MKEQDKGKAKHCETNRARRPRYFHGMLLDERDFQAEQSYHIDSRRRLNRMLHGWGVVCGLGVGWTKGNNWIELGSGFALDCCGREIWVPECQRVDLSELVPRPPKGGKEECPDPEEKGQEQEFCICLSYREVPTDPVPVYVPGGDCNERTCDFSRVQEGYCVQLAECCCECHATDPILTRMLEVLDPARCGEEAKESKEEPEPPARPLCCVLPCAECAECGCPDHGVPIGKVRVDGRGCVIEVTCDCRVHIASARILPHVMAWSFAWIHHQYGQKTGDQMSLADLACNPVEVLCRLSLPDKQWNPAEEYLPQMDPPANAGQVEQLFAFMRKSQTEQGSRIEEGAEQMHSTFGEVEKWMSRFDEERQHWEAGYQKMEKAVKGSATKAQMTRLRNELRECQKTLADLQKKIG